MPTIHGDDVCLSDDSLDWIPDNAPFIEIEPEKVKVLQTPDEFYDQIMKMISLCRKRIMISTLYVGKSSYEDALIDQLEEALNRNPGLKMSILMDCLRGTRGGLENSSASNLKRLVPRASVYLFHTPHLRGWKRILLPERFNEVVGLQHMKLLVFDDNVMITGANLSEIYFTNRQDRYVLIEDCPQLADFLDSLIEAVGSCSFMLNLRGTTRLANGCNVHPFEETLKESNQVNFTSCTRIYPLLQMGIVSIDQEFEYMKNLLSRKSKELSLTLSSGYFNFTDSYVDLITNHGSYDVDIVYASPQANGFYQASGLSGFIPQMYVYISKLFFQTTRSEVRLLEYDRPGWSYHAKGLWIIPKQSPFSATIIGSSNFGHRSIYRDLEAQFFIVTSNERLKKSLQEERLRILDSAAKVDIATFLRRDHYVPFWIRLISQFIRNYF